MTKLKNFNDFDIMSYGERNPPYVRAKNSMIKITKLLYQIVVTNRGTRLYISLLKLVLNYLNPMEYLVI
jgi:hypothetical protein